MKDHTPLMRLLTQMHAGRLSHAYLFYGEGPEKKEAARVFASALTHVEKDVSVNPDILLCEIAEGEEKHSIDEMRKVKQFLSFEPYFGKCKVVIIDAFERMGEAASSALLKVLEEPPQRSVIILLSSHPKMLMPTILSRVQKVRFFGKGEADIDKEKEILYNLAALIHANVALRFVMVEKLVKENENDVLLTWVPFFRDMSYLAVSGCEGLVEHTSLREELARLLKTRKYTLHELHTILSELIAWSWVARTTNTNKRLIVENIALRL